MDMRSLLCDGIFSFSELLEMRLDPPTSDVLSGALGFNERGATSDDSRTTRPTSGPRLQENLLLDTETLSCPDRGRHNKIWTDEASRRTTLFHRLTDAGRYKYSNAWNSLLAGSEITGRHSVTRNTLWASQNGGMLDQAPQAPRDCRHPERLGEPAKRR